MGKLSDGGCPDCHGKKVKMETETFEVGKRTQQVQVAVVFDKWATYVQWVSPLQTSSEINDAIMLGSPPLEIFFFW